MNDRDKQEIGFIMAEVLEKHAPVCPNGIDADTAATLKAFAEAVRVGKKTVYKTVLAAIATAILGAFVVGVCEFFKKQ